jgi:hypothetical protein
MFHGFHTAGFSPTYEARLVMDKIMQNERREKDLEDEKIRKAEAVKKAQEAELKAIKDGHIVEIELQDLPRPKLLMRS